MDSILKSEQAMEILTTISLAQFLVIVAIIIGIVIFIFKFKDKIKDIFENYRQETNKKEAWSREIESYGTRIANLEAHHEQDIKDMVESQKKYRQQSIEKQQAIDNHFNSLENKLDTVLVAIQKIDSDNQELKAENDKVKCNELRDRLLQMHRYYTSLENNPRQEWSELEAETFWELFKEYEKRGGNGHMHSHVKPEMEKLTVIYF